MDSLLSNAQRCVRKADSLTKYGLFDEALRQLDRSIIFLNELKSITTCYDSIQMLNVQIDSIDRKMRSVAIKRSESIKKKSQIENILNSKNKKDSYINIKQDQIQKIQQQQQSSVLIEKNENKQVFRNASKLIKDDKSIIEELSTTNTEYKKVNEFLINEIENLKKENDYLKVELLKIHMNDSLSEDLTSSASGSYDNKHNSSSISNSSSSIINSSNASNSNSNSLSNNYLNDQLPGLNMTSQQLKQTNPKSHVLYSSSSSSANNKIDLSKYINNEDSDAEVDDDIFFSNNKNPSLEDSYTSANMNLPPNEFTID